MANTAAVFAIIAQDNGNDNDHPITMTTTMNAGRCKHGHSLCHHSNGVRNKSRPMAHSGEDHPNNGNCGGVNGNSNGSGNNTNNSSGDNDVGVDGGCWWD